MINKSNLILIDFPIFILLEKGDSIYYEKFNPLNGNTKITKCEVIFSKWYFSGEDTISKKTLKPFYYRQICFVDDQNKKWYCDSAGCQFLIYKDMYIDKELLAQLENRKKKKKKA